MDMAGLFAVVSADTNSKQAFVTNGNPSLGVDVSEKGSIPEMKAVPFGQALKLMSKSSSVSEKTVEENTESLKAVAGEEVDAERMALLVQSRIPFSAVILTENEKPVVHDKVIASGKSCMVMENVSAKEPFEAINSLFDKANQLQQNFSADKNHVKTEIQTKEQGALQELMQKVAYAGEQEFVAKPQQVAPEQVDAKGVFGEKLTQEKIPELVANNDLQQKVMLQTKEQSEPLETTKTEKAGQVKTFVVNEEKTQLPQSGKQEQIATVQKELFTLAEGKENSSDAKGQMFQQQPKASSIEFFSGKKPMETDLEESSLTSNTAVATVQAKEIAPQKVFFTEEPVRLDDVRALADKMVEQVRLTQKPGMTEMVIKLKPENLGEMTIRIIAESGGAITAAFHSNSSEVRGILQEALPVIRQELANSGLKVHDVGVYAGLSDFQSFTGHDQRSAEQQVIAGVATNRLSKEEQELLEELQLAKNGENQSDDGGVDYRV